MTTAFPSGHSSSAFTAFLARDDPLGPANYALAAAELLSEAAKHRHVKTIEIAQDAVRTWLGYVHGCPRLGWDGAGRPMRVVEATE